MKEAKEKACNWVGGREDLIELGRGKIYFMKTLKIKSSFYSGNRINHKKCFKNVRYFLSNYVSKFIKKLVEYKKLGL